MQKIGIVGAGLIGRAWSIVFARAGCSVALYDISPELVRSSIGLIDAGLRDLRDHGLLDDPDAALARITPAATLAETVAGATYVQENGPERVEDKRAIFAELDRLAPPDAVLASSTSAILPALFTEDLTGRARCLVAHPVNPPHLVPLVELCAAPWTAPETVERARLLLDEVGQVPILVRKEIEGFILNRLQGALLNEAWRLVDEGYVSAADLDKTVSQGLGLRWSFMGPLETIDLNAPAGLADYMRRYGPFYRRIAEAGRTAPLWRESLADRLEAERRAEVAADRLPARQVWRDRRLMALLRHKADQENADQENAETG